MRIWAAMIAVLAALSACAPMPYDAPTAPPVRVEAPDTGRLQPRDAARNFISVVDRVEPMVESFCRAQTRGVNCDFAIVIDDRRGQPPNAFQTIDKSGRPILGFTLSLIAEARNADEIAFVLGHEASHHILGHIPQQKQSAATAAALAGMIMSASGAGPEAVRSAQSMGASFGARTYAREFELQADALGAEIAWQAGYDPVLGAGFFDRLPDPGDAFLGSHPPNAQRKALVRRVVARLESAGL
jgi:predicted Zn-dependent protease